MTEALQLSPVVETPPAVPEHVAVVLGDRVTELPQDLYIPPGALRVFLEAFEGPLDLLLYLIRKQNLDILNIPIAEITRQYVQYVEVMQELQLELAAEYLVMAALLAEIKSRMLLPKPDSQEEEVDPRAELIRRLQQYEVYKKAAEDLDALTRVDRDVFPAYATPPTFESAEAEVTVNFDEILNAFKEVMERARLYTSHQITRELLSVSERMSKVLELVGTEQFVRFQDLFTVQEGRMGVVVTFIALLELMRRRVIELAQSEPFAPIYVRRHKDIKIEEFDEVIYDH